MRPRTAPTPPRPRRPHPTEIVPSSRREGGRRALASDQAGFTVIEVLVAAVILIVGVLGLVAMIDTANAKTASVRAREGGTNLARQVLEAGRSIPDDSLAPGSITANLQAQPGLEDDGSGAGWTIQRRGFAYTVVVSVCTIDDAADGTGAHDAGVYCADSPAAGTSDGNPDDYKRVTVDVSWSSGSARGSVHQTALLNNPGDAGSAAVTSLTLTSPIASPITSAVSPISFAVTTSVPAATVTWSVDGAVQGTAPGSGTSLTVSWPVTGLSDGTYLITARPYSSNGFSGASRSLNVTLNRFAPAAPTGFLAGRNGSVVDFEWLPNPERDIVDYRVFRVVAGGTDVVVCDRTKSTSCQDPSPPSGSVSYYVVAEDLDPAGQYRAGPNSSTATVTATNQRPNAPTNLTATSSNGAVVLSWQAPTVPDPDGDAIAFYRIYRDGTAFAWRYDRTGSGSDLTFTDTHTGGTPHSYWITAVDPQLAESAPVGPVTL